MVSIEVTKNTISQINKIKSITTTRGGGLKTKTITSERG